MAQQTNEGLWAKVQTLTNHIHSCQSSNGIVLKEDKAEAKALERQRSAVQMQLKDAGTEFLKAHNFTAGGRVRNKKRIPGL